MRFSTVTVFFGAFLGFLLAAIMAAKPVFPQEADWSGVYVQGQVGFGLGEHTLSYENEDYGITADIYQIPLEGNAQAFGLGYRREVGDSRLYLGARFMAHRGLMQGSKAWSGHEGDVGAQVDFSSNTVYTAGGELGYEFAPRWYGYLGAGLAGAELSWQGQVHAFGYETSHAEEGWAPGAYLALGAMRDLGKGLAVGVEAQWFHFEAEEQVQGFGHDLGTFKATVDDARVMLTLSKTL
jgi:opacity protein-like surface antigen